MMFCLTDVRLSGLLNSTVQVRCGRQTGRVHAGIVFLVSSSLRLIPVGSLYQHQSSFIGNL